MNRESILGAKISHPPREGVVISNNDSIALAQDKQGVFERPPKKYDIMSTRYQVYSCDGLACPLGLPYPPAGYGHTLIVDNLHGCVRCLTLKE